MKTIRIGTRKSKLALYQANLVKQKIQTYFPDHTVDLIHFVTTGDRFLNAQLSTLGGKGAFVKEIEDALLKNTVDMAVHSMKDMPTELIEDLEVAVILKRESPNDAFISTSGLHKIDELDRPLTIGTSSVRRKSQLLRYNPNLTIVELRGNIDTRLAKLQSEPLDAIILAEAGINRLNLGKCTPIPFDIMLPPPAQGAIGIETRKNNPHVQHILEKLNDPDSFLTVSAERTCLQALQGSCHVPIAIHATLAANEISISARVLSLNGKEIAENSIIGPKNLAQTLAMELGSMLIAGGAKLILKEIFENENS